LPIFRANWEKIELITKKESYCSRKRGRNRAVDWKSGTATAVAEMDVSCGVELGRRRGALGRRPRSPDAGGRRLRVGGGCGWAAPAGERSLRVSGGRGVAPAGKRRRRGCGVG
jgi:hypothetical protein